MGGYLAMAMAMAAMTGTAMTDSVDYEKQHTKRNTVKIIPKGSKKYVFDWDGNITSEIDVMKVAFTCVAINEKNAIKKYKKWLANL